MDTISAGVHIFGRQQTKALDNHFIYLELSSDKDFTTFLKELKINNGFHERCGKLGIPHFDTELTILEKKDRKLVVINNNTSWKHALKLLLKEEAELHVKLFDVKRASSCNFFEVGSSGAHDNMKKDSESSEPATKNIKSHHSTHSEETKAKLSLWHRIKNAQKMGTEIIRNDTEQKLFKGFTKDIKALASSVAVNEISVKCGICDKKVLMNKVRARSYFIKKHFKKCQDDKRNQTTIEACLEKKSSSSDKDDNHVQDFIDLFLQLKQAKQHALRSSMISYLPYPVSCLI